MIDKRTIRPRLVVAAAAPSAPASGEMTVETFSTGAGGPHPCTVTAAPVGLDGAGAGDLAGANG